MKAMSALISILSVYLCLCGCTVSENAKTIHSAGPVFPGPSEAPSQAPPAEPPPETPPETPPATPPVARPEAPSPAPQPATPPATTTQPPVATQPSPAESGLESWRFLCTQKGLLLTFPSNASDAHLAEPIAVYDTEVAHPLDPTRPGEEMDGLNQAAPVSLDGDELVVMALGHPIARPGAAATATESYHIRISLTRHEGLAERRPAIPGAANAFAGEPSVRSFIGGRDVTVSGDERAGALLLTDARTIERIPYPIASSRGRILQGLWASEKEIFAALAADDGVRVYRLTTEARWERVTNDSCEPPVTAIKRR